MTTEYEGPLGGLPEDYPMPEGTETGTVYTGELPADGVQVECSVCAKKGMMLDNAPKPGMVVLCSPFCVEAMKDRVNMDDVQWLDMLGKLVEEGFEIPQYLFDLERPTVEGTE